AAGRLPAGVTRTGPGAAGAGSGPAVGDLGASFCSGFFSGSRGWGVSLGASAAGVFGAAGSAVASPVVASSQRYGLPPFIWSPGSTSTLTTLPATGVATSRAALSACTSSTVWSLASTSPGATFTALTSTLSTPSFSAASLISLAIRPPRVNDLTPASG